MFILPQKYWEVRQTPDKGRGIFAMEDIPAGSVIGDYLGKVMSDDQPGPEEYKNQLYDMWYSETQTIFADPKVIGIHLINHSCMPNLDTYDYKGHTLYYALRPIFKGEELTISYDLGPPDEFCNPCTHACLCKTPMCTGSWHSVDDENDYTLTEEEQAYLQPSGTDLAPLLDYPKTVSFDKPERIYGTLDTPGVNYDDMSVPTHEEIMNRIRKTGKTLYFTKLNLEVLGIFNGMVISR